MLVCEVYTCDQSSQHSDKECDDQQRQLVACLDSGMAAISRYNAKSKLLSSEVGCIRRSTGWKHMVEAVPAEQGEGALTCPRIIPIDTRK